MGEGVGTGAIQGPPDGEDCSDLLYNRALDFPEDSCKVRVHHETSPYTGVTISMEVSEGS